MTEKQKESWAANIAFVSDEETVQEIYELLEKKESEGKIKDLLTMDGPYDSLQLMLKRRKENFRLETKPQSEEDKSNE